MQKNGASTMQVSITAILKKLPGLLLKINITFGLFFTTIIAIAEDSTQITPPNLQPNLVLHMDSGFITTSPGITNPFFETNAKCPPKFLPYAKITPMRLNQSNTVLQKLTLCVTSYQNSSSTGKGYTMYYTSNLRAVLKLEAKLCNKINEQLYVSNSESYWGQGETYKLVNGKSCSDKFFIGEKTASSSSVERGQMITTENRDISDYLTNMQWDLYCYPASSSSPYQTVNNGNTYTYLTSCSP